MYEGNVEETFMQPFQISYQDVFGSTISHDLKENGTTIMVTNFNRQVRNVRFVGIVSSVVSEMKQNYFWLGR